MSRSQHEPKHGHSETHAQYTAAEDSVSTDMHGGEVNYDKIEMVIVLAIVSESSSVRMLAVRQDRHQRPHRHRHD